ncbi:MAG: acyltransferase family protein [Eubacteriales bacterium]|nr:acyltransferase family protein [Eubacteriales bacterium]
MKAAIFSEPISPQTTRIVYIDLLRIVACMAVIMLHVSADNWYSLDPASFNWQVLNAYDSIARFCVPVFFMISGTFFLNPDRKLPLKVLYKKNILRIVVAYLFWSLLYAVKEYLISGEVLALPDAIIFILVTTAESHYHLWFLPVLTGLYIITPLLRQLTGKPEVEKYFLILFFIFGISLPTLLLFELPYTWILQTVVVMEVVTGYAGYFVLGRYLYTHGVSKRFRLTAYALGVLGILACIVVSAVYSLQAHEPVAKLYENNLLTTFFPAAAIFLFFKYCVSGWRWVIRHQRLIQSLSSCTFGAYLIHDFFLSALYNAGVHSLAFNTIAAVPLVTLAIFILSMGSAWLIRRIPVIHRYIT